MGSSSRSPQRNRAMSRAFVNEDGGVPDPRHRYPLPSRDDPGFDEAAARALLQGANEGDSDTAEAATGYRFGEPKLVPWIRQLLERARATGNDRQEQLAERFLRRAGVEVD
jgi:hypothetical protein